ncbi:MAG: dihydroneopterin aldolase [Candidatus Lokiarchaeota archaeon]|nr:dihydroneopterin aldolase [Candidatus Lokiarchaeota archaeon]
MSRIEDVAKKYFAKEVNDRDRAIFEAGISLGALFHQFTGIPIKNDKEFLDNIEKTIKQSIQLQPFIKSVDIRIKKNDLKKGKNTYDYSTLSGNNLHVILIAEYGEIKVRACIKYIEKLDYPLMYIDKIES